MRIDINQKKISVGDKFDIFTDGQQTHSAATELFKFLSVINLNLFDRETTRTRLKIRKLWSWFKPKYDILLHDNRNLEFRAKSFWKLHYQCLKGPDLYDIYGHRGRKFSVYKNNTQIAWWDKQTVSWFKGDNYTIFANSDSDAELIIAFCLIVDNYSHNKDDGNAVKVDYGNIGGQVKKFNPDWKPDDR